MTDCCMCCYGIHADDGMRNLAYAALCIQIDMMFYLLLTLVLHRGDGIFDLLTFCFFQVHRFMTKDVYN